MQTERHGPPQVHVRLQNGSYLLCQIVDTCANDNIVLEPEQRRYSLRDPPLHDIHVDLLHVNLH